MASLMVTHFLAIGCLALVCHIDDKATLCESHPQSYVTIQPSRFWSELTQTWLLEPLISFESRIGLTWEGVADVLTIK